MKEIDFSSRDVEVDGVVLGAHPDAYLRWRAEAEKRVIGKPYDESIYRNRGMPELPSLGHVKDCPACMEIVKRSYAAYCLIKDLQEYLNITEEDAWNSYQKTWRKFFSAES